MARLLRGKEVGEALTLEINKLNTKLNKPACLAIFKVGDRANDASYQRGIEKKCEQFNISIKYFLFKEDVLENEFFKQLEVANNDPNINGILIFRPIKQFDDNKLRNAINPNKDVDGCGDLSLAGIFVGNDVGFIPCTAQAAMEILKYYQVPLSGKRVAIIGRSLVIGKPVSMLLLKENATVTICHTKTKDITNITKDSDIIICASGQMESIDKNYVKEGQTIIDVGLNYNEAKQKLCGDCLFEEVEPIVKEITPVPGGVGAITTLVLLKHVLEAAIRQNV